MKPRERCSRSRGRASANAWESTVTSPVAPDRARTRSSRRPCGEAAGCDSVDDERDELAIATPVTGEHVDLEGSLQELGPGGALLREIEAERPLGEGQRRGSVCGAWASSRKGCIRRDMAQRGSRAVRSKRRAADLRTDAPWIYASPRSPAARARFASAAGTDSDPTGKSRTRPRSSNASASDSRRATSTAGPIAAAESTNEPGTSIHRLAGVSCAACRSLPP